MTESTVNDPYKDNASDTASAGERAVGLGSAEERRLLLEKLNSGDTPKQLTNQAINYLIFNFVLGIFLGFLFAIPFGFSVAMLKATIAGDKEKAITRRTTARIFMISLTLMIMLMMVYAHFN